MVSCFASWFPVPCDLTLVEPDIAGDEMQPLTALNLAILKDLWMPDVEIRNLQSFETHTILSKLEGLWVDDDHNLMHALASRITFICPMRFNSFPLDVQVTFLFC